jgi:hypothetical protein
MELTSVYGDEAFQISAIKKWRTRFLAGKRELGNVPRSGRHANSDWTQVIAELIRERPFLSCKILFRDLRVSKETSFKILPEKLGPKKFHLRWIPHQLTPNKTWKLQELPCHINFLKFSSLAKQGTL